MNFGRRSGAGSGPLVVVLVAALLGGCASLRPSLEPPEATLTRLELTEVGVFDQRYRMGLRLENPNKIALDVSNMTWELFIDGERFMKADTTRPFLLPANGDTELDMNVTTSLIGLFRQLIQWSNGPPRPVRYSIVGEVHLARGLVRKIPFTSSGEIALERQQP